MGVSVGSSDRGQDVELNLASIIDCLTVLIAYTLISASFLTVGVLDAAVLPPGSAPIVGQTPEAHLKVALKGDYSIEVGIRNPAGEIIEKSEILPKTDGTFDVETLQAKVDFLRGRFAGLEQVDLGAQSQVLYKDVVYTVEQMRKILPTVVLGDL